MEWYWIPALMLIIVLLAMLLTLLLEILSISLHTLIGRICGDSEWEHRVNGAWLRFLRRLHRIPSPKISRSEALTIAREECKKRDMGVIDPVSVQEKLEHYFIWTNADSRGGNVSMDIDNQDGSVTGFGVVPY